MVHDRYINQYLIYVIYALLMGFLIVRKYETLLRLAPFTFLIAGFLLAMSIVSDVLQPIIPLTYDQVQIIEEGFKFTGAGAWLYLHIAIGTILLKEIVYSLKKS